MSIEKAKEVIENIKTGLEAGHDTFLPKTVGDLREALALLEVVKAEITEKDKQISDLQAEIERLNNANKLLREQDVAQKTWGQVFALIKDVEDKCVAKLIDQDKQISDLQAENDRLKRAIKIEAQYCKDLYEILGTTGFKIIREKLEAAFALAEPKEEKKGE